MAPRPGDPIPEICPSCENDPVRGAELRERRIAALRAEILAEREDLEIKTAALAYEIANKEKRKRPGCAPVFIALVVVLTAATVSRTCETKQRTRSRMVERGIRGFQWQR
jgi:hypothetical protein